LEPFALAQLLAQVVGVQTLKMIVRAAGVGVFASHGAIVGGPKGGREISARKV
jgi:hypothetical protein